MRESTCSSLSKNVVWIGGCYQHGGATASVDTYYNTTSPTPLPKTGDRNGGGLCDCTNEYTNTDSGSNWNSCFFGDGRETWQNSDVDCLTFQTFTVGSVIPFGGCGDKRHIGFKNVVAKKQWPGTFGFTSNDVCNVTETASPDQTKYCSISNDFDFSYTFTPGIAVIDYDTNAVTLKQFTQNQHAGTCGGSNTVNAQTGIITSNMSFTYDEYTFYSMDMPLRHDFHSVNGAGWTLNYTSGTFETGLNAPFNTDIGTPTNCTSDLGFLNYWVGWWNGVCLEYDPSNVQNSSITPPVSTNGWSASKTLTSIYSMPFFNGSEWVNVTHSISATCEVSVARSNDTYTFSITIGGGFSSSPDTGYGTYAISYAGSVTLGGEYTYANVGEDLVGMLNEWNLQDDKQYPWRTDNKTSFAPLVIKREVQGNVSPIGNYCYKIIDYTSPLTDINGVAPFEPDWIATYEYIPWQDNRSYYWGWVTGYEGQWANAMVTTHYDGTLIGKPHPNGPGGWGWFDCYYNDIHFCKTPTDYTCFGPMYQEYTWAYGASLADAIVSVSGTPSAGQMTFLPMCATHWVDNALAHYIPRGGGIVDVAGQCVVMSKWAEIRTPVPSYNFFRPCGMDRTLIDTPTVQSFKDVLTMTNDLVGLTTTSQVLIAYTDSDNGIYTNCSTTLVGSDYVLTLGTKICNLPSGYSYPYADFWNDQDILGNFGLVGIVRFPDAFGITGRESITIAGSSTGSIVTFSNPQVNLRTNDKVTLYDTGMTMLTTNKTITKLDDNNFYISSSFSGAITTSKWIQSYGSPDYSWNDTSEKFQFRYSNWQTNRAGTTGGTCVESCLNQTPCSPQVFCISPNLEVFVNGVTTWIDGYNADDVYGSMNQINAEFDVVDPLYQTPKCPDSHFGVVLKCAVDTGLCADDFIDEDGALNIFAPPVPKVEALCSVPVGAPALPTGITWPTMTRPGQPGVLGYSYYFKNETWQTYANALALDPACRFYKYYYLGPQ